MMYGWFGTYGVQIDVYELLSLYTYYYAILGCDILEDVCLSLALSNEHVRQNYY